MTSLPSIPDDKLFDDGGFGFVASSTAASNIVPLRFIKGQWLRGFDRAPEPPDLEYVALGASEAWQRLERDTPPQRIPRIPGELFPTRRELGDLDEGLWPKFDNKPNDPWSLVNELLLADRQTGQFLGYTASSITARNVVADLCRLIEFQQRTRGKEARPVVKIGTATLNLRRGPVAVPRFDIVDWLGGAAAPELPPSKLQADLTAQLGQRSDIDPKAKSTEPPKRRKAEPPRPKPPDVPWEDELDDRIPL